MAVVAPLIGGLAGGWVASSLGYAVGSIGYAIGTGVGSMLGSALVPQPGVEGPRAGDNTVQTSTYGASIPIVYGTVRISGNVIWSSGIREVKSTSEQGKGGGQEVTTYAYFADWAVGLCEGQIGGVRRVWLDADLVYDATSTDAAVIAASAKFLDSMTVYSGSETQTADPVIQAAVGVPDCPAYRGLAYLVFEDIAINEFGNRIPNVMVELWRCVSAPPVQPYLVDPENLVVGPSIAPWDFGGPAFSAAPTCATGVEYTYYMVGLTGGPFSTISALLAHAAARHSSFAGVINASAFHWHYGGVSSLSNPAIALIDGTYQPAAFPEADTLVILYGGYGDRVPKDDPIIYVTDSTGVCDAGLFNCTLNLYQKFAQPNLQAYVGKLLPSGETPEYGYTYCGSVCGGTRGYVDVGSETVQITARRKRGCAELPSSQYCKTHPVLYYAGSDSTPSYLTGLPQESPVLLEGDPGYTAGALVPDYATWSSDQSGDFLQYLYGNGASPAPIVSLACEVAQPCSGSWALVDGEMVCIHYDTDANTVACALGSVDLGALVADLCYRLGIPCNASALVGTTVSGYVVSRQMTARAAIEPLQRAYFIDAVETSGRVAFIPRGQAVAASYDDDDLGAAETGETRRLAIQRGNETDLPRKVTVSYMDYDRDHEVNVQSAPRLTTSALSESVIECAIVMSADEAAQKAEITLVNTWIGREQIGFSLPYSEITRQPADVVTLSVAGETWRVRITKIDYSLPGALKCMGTAERSDTWSSAAVGVVDSEYIPSPAPVLNAALTGHVLDTPLLSDLHDPAGVYVAASTAGAWGGGKLLLSIDGGTTYSEAATLNLCTVGTALSVLADHAPETLDRANTVRVSLLRADQSLSSIGAASALMHASNLALLGSEIIVYESAALITPGVYDLSILHRGLRGTDINTSAHAVGERFILLDGNVQRLALTDTLIGSTIHLKFVQVGELASNVTPTSHYHAALAHECYSPSHLAASDNGDGTWDIAWMRRNRLDGEWRDYVETTMSESTERYLVAVFNGSTLVQTLDTSNSYANAITASPGWTVEVCQISAKTGPGFTGVLTL